MRSRGSGYSSLSRISYHRHSMSKQTVAIVGASRDRTKYGNKAVRAYIEQGWEVFPVHPCAADIEGLKAYRSVRDIPGRLDRVTLYLPPEKGLEILEDIARKGAGELMLNPGAESPALMQAARALGLEPIVACSIRIVGADPADFPS